MLLLVLLLLVLLLLVLLLLVLLLLVFGVFFGFVSVKGTNTDFYRLIICCLDQSITLMNVDKNLDKKRFIISFTDWIIGLNRVKNKNKKERKKRREILLFASLTGPLP